MAKQQVVAAALYLHPFVLGLLEQDDVASELPRSRKSGHQHLLDLPGIGHGESPRTTVRNLKVFIFESISVNRLAAWCMDE